MAPAEKKVDPGTVRKDHCRLTGVPLKIPKSGYFGPVPSVMLLIKADRWRLL